MGPFKDSSEVSRRAASGFGKHSLMVGAMAPGLLEASNAIGGKFVESISRKGGSPYRFGLLVWTVAICFFSFVSLRDTRYAISLPMMFFLALNLQTMYILLKRTVRTGLDYGESPVSPSAGLAGILALGMLAYQIYSNGESYFFLGIDSMTYWVAIIGTFALANAGFFVGGMGASAEYAATLKKKNNLSVDVDELKSIVWAHLKKKGNVTFKSHVRGILFFSLPLTIVHGFATGLIRI